MRDDLSNKLIHFTKGQTPEEAKTIFQLIVSQKNLLEELGKFEEALSVYVLQNHQLQKCKMYFLAQVFLMLHSDL